MHIGVVTLNPAAACVCFPSKTYALLAAGLAVLAIAPRDSDVARVVEETGAGWVVDNQGFDGAATGEAVAALIRKLVRDPKDVWRRREAARFAAMTRFSRQSVTKLWQDLLAEVTA
jgi:glycosyltransferase involved in cell wall biosynthesis